MSLNLSCQFIAACSCADHGHSSGIAQTRYPSAVVECFACHLAKAAASPDQAPALTTLAAAGQRARNLNFLDYTPC